jgi:hypothetical protein
LIRDWDQRELVLFLFWGDFCLVAGNRSKHPQGNDADFQAATLAEFDRLTTTEFLESAS